MHLGQATPLMQPPTLEPPLQDPPLTATQPTDPPKGHLHPTLEHQPRTQEAPHQDTTPQEQGRHTQGHSHPQGTTLPLPTRLHPRGMGAHLPATPPQQATPHIQVSSLLWAAAPSDQLRQVLACTGQML